MNIRITVILCLAAIIATTSCSKMKKPALHSWSPTRIVNVELSQLTFVFDDGIHRDTDWGQARIRYRMDRGSELLYLNLFFNGEWVVQNVPVRNGSRTPQSLMTKSNDQTTTVGTPKPSNTDLPVDEFFEVVVQFDLGIESGTVINKGSFACILWPDIWIGGTPQEELEEVCKGTIAIVSGIKGARVTLKEPVEPSKWADGVKAKKKAFHDPKTIVNQNCGYQECFVTAISNSLKMLKAQNPAKFKEIPDNPKSDKDEIDIPNIKKKTKFQPPADSYNPYKNDLLSSLGSGGSPPGDDNTNDPEACWNLKKSWADANPKLPIKTTTIDSKDKMAELDKAIKNGCDVEFLAAAHAAMVTGVIELENGNLVFEMADDILQGKGPFKPDPSNPEHKGKKAHNGGTYTTLLKYDVKKNEFTGRAAWEGTKMTPAGKSQPIFVIECVE